MRRKHQTADIRNHGSVLSCNWRSPCRGTLGRRPITPCRVVICWVLWVCRVVTCWVLWACWVGTCRVLILCRVGNSCWVVHNLRLLLFRAEIPCWLVTCWVLCLCRVRGARHTCRVGQSCRVCLALHTCRVVRLCWPGRRRDHCDDSLLSPLWCNREQLDLTSGHVWRPRPHGVHTLTSVMMLRPGPGPTIRRWPRGMTLMMSGRTRRPDLRRPPRSMTRPRSIRRVSMPGSRAGPSPRRGRVRSPLLRHLGQWRDLGESWRLSDPWPCLPRSPLRDLWCSDPLVPEGTGPPSDLDLPTTETLDERVFFLSRDLDGRPADSASIALDEVADSAFFFVLDDPSSLRLAGGTWIPSSGAWISIESSTSWVFFAAFSCRPRLAFPLLLNCFLQRFPCFGQPVLAHITRSFLCAKRQSLIEAALLATEVGIAPSSVVRATRKLQLRFRGRWPITWLCHLV